MATKPTPGGSDGTWGTELNAHLAVSLAADGKVLDGAVFSTSAAPTVDAGVANKKYVDDQITANAVAAAAVCKGWVQHNSAGTKQGTGLNITSTAKTATGEYTVTWDTNFANDDYACVITPVNSTTDLFVTIETHAVGSVHYRVSNDSGGSVDAACHVIAFGDQ